MTIATWFNRVGVSLTYTLVLSSLSVSATAQQLPTPNSTRVHIARDVNVTAQRVLVGAGITLGAGASPSHGDAVNGSIVWKSVRRHRDAQGGEHVFYRQHLARAGESVEIFGSDIGVHSDETGKIWLISGNQFEDVRPTNRVGFGAAAAVERAHARLGERPGLRAEPSTPQKVRLWREANSKLKLVWDGVGFKYAWFTSARDDRGHDYDFVLDAENATVLAFRSNQLATNCYPTGWPGGVQTVAAIGRPVRENELPNVTRPLAATVAPDRPETFDYEAFRPGAVNISILQETDANDFKCTPGTSNSYTLIPLSAGWAGVEYSGDGQWKGSAAGDALHHTRLTMEAFASLGRAGWDGQNGDANVVLESTGITRGATDHAYFGEAQYTPPNDPRYPPTDWVGIKKSSGAYTNMASALDLVAHEWGHGVIAKSAAFPYKSSDTALELHEGFADVIGMIVEKMKQDPGTGLEQSDDWTMHEDNLPLQSGAATNYVRGAIDDVAGHDYQLMNPDPLTGSYTHSFNQYVHRDDTGGTNYPPYSRANMLSMVFRLMTEGGRNPICSRLPQLDGCNVSVTGLGLTKASKILFDTVQFFAPPSAQWGDLPDYAMAAAYYNYARCWKLPGYPAATEQQTVIDAFRNIGIATVSPQFDCTEPF